jgi:hypothetical protein
MGRGRAAAGRDSWCAARGRKTSMASPGRSGRLPLPLCHGLVHAVCWIPWPHKPHGCPRSEREGQALRKRDPADLASTNLAARVPTTLTGPTLTLLIYRCAVPPAGMSSLPRFPALPAHARRRLLSLLAVCSRFAASPSEHVVPPPLGAPQSSLGLRSATGILAIGFCTQTTPRHTMLCVVA